MCNVSPVCLYVSNWLANVSFFLSTNNFYIIEENLAACRDVTPNHNIHAVIHNDKTHTGNRFNVSHNVKITLLRTGR